MEKMILYCSNNEKGAHRASCIYRWNNTLTGGCSEGLGAFIFFFNPFGTIGLTMAIFFLLDSPVLLALFYMGQPP